MHIKVDIIIINYNNYLDTIECIESIRNNIYLNYKITIVDNASLNNSVEKLSEYLNKEELIISNHNVGFAGGNNIGIKKALSDKSEYILLLNNDVVVKSDFLLKMIESFERNKETGIVGCKICSYYDYDCICHAGGEIDLFKFITKDYSSSENNNEKYTKEREVEYISGCCMLIKREIFDKVGLLPEEYFMYYEDTDFCVKVKEKGYKLIYNPEAVIYHKISSSTGGEDSPFAIQWNIRNRMLFMQKFKYKVSKISFIGSLLYFYSTRLLRYLMYGIKKDKERTKAVSEGIKEGIKACKEYRNKNKSGDAY